MTDTPTDLDVVSDPSKIDFLRSTTTTRVERTGSGAEPEISVEHYARFAAEEGVVPDMTHRYGSQTFAPRFITATWVDGKLERVRATGPRRLKSGKLQGEGINRHAESREQEWRGRSLDPDATGLGSYDVPLPKVIADRLRAYETEVATLTGGRK
ncbi:hypothetical protein I5G58_gp064 [Mycobacterium phage BirdsNest]|uniref:Uncharacterized protein n=1 Tax=Mycobacterium phage BirdsNest TaxID=2686231 RepID=A0A6B9L6Z7_9CAUD|nr:hypothetical protein I5G58_gp064 [Mycobacterium phage BirdsNest]QHB37366.1 hypothetical protein PBI_BIRDSNEST_64 [Mycobacterium phage BirdsNest]